MGEQLKTVGAFAVAGLAGGTVMSVLNAGQPGFSLLTPVYVGMAAAVAGVFWAVLRASQQGPLGAGLFYVGCLGAALVFANVLLTFGYTLNAYLPDATLKDRLSVSIGAAVGGAVWAVVHRWQGRER